MNDWMVVKSKSGTHHECGYPIGEILIRNSDDIQKVIKEHKIYDPIVIPYLEKGSKNE